MGYLLACARKDLARRMADPMALLVWIGIPLVLGGLLSLVSGGGGDRHVKVLLVDQDETFASELLAGVFQQGPGEGLFETRAVDLEEGRALIDEGEASALVVIPEGFADALLLDEPAALQMVTNPSQRIFPGLIEETLAAICDLSFYAQRLLGPQLQEIRGRIDEDRPPTSLEVASIAVEVNDSITILDGILFPPVLEFETAPLEPEAADEEEESSGGVSLPQMMFPGMLFMALLFVAQGVSEDLWKERTAGTLRRAACAPGSIAWMLLGKVTSTAIVMFAIALLGVILMAAFFGLDLVGGVLGVLWGSLAAAGFAVLMLFLQSLAGSHRGGGTVTMLVLFPLLMVGGSFFPFEAMPDSLAAIGRRTPNGMALIEMRRFFDGEVDPAALARTALILGAGSAALFALLVRRVRRVFVAGGGA